MFRLFDQPRMAAIVDILVVHGPCDVKELSDISRLQQNSVHQVARGTNTVAYLFTLLFLRDHLRYAKSF
jgi:hypothetical protein